MQQVILRPTIGFSAQLSKHVYLGDAQAVKYDKVITNYDQGYKKFTGHFTAPLKGLYLFSCTIMEYRDYYIHVEIVKNRVRISTIHANKYVFDQSSQTVVLALRKGDSVWTRQSASERYLWKHIGYSMFTGILVSEDI
ncbi:complement C1q tumor necrosis factor-related protein 3-like [Saccostrea cucullata]|uniref:complement C1q tumor necrosis factor-related protein 3-like n=1 Tax=Saccostrea cuccullata TaxID=36930 RepID=UPI002ED65AE6